MLNEKQQEMVALFEKHVGAELDGDLDTTMATMIDEPHLHNVPTMTGGFGHDGVRRFYRDHLIGKFFPPDVKMERVSLTVGVKDAKVSHEHIYWDQASALVQLGLLDPAGLPVVGAESARRLLNPKLPSRE
jgi:carboxymethylenebutenolidase